MAYTGVFADLLPKQDHFTQALYTFDIGQNDITSGYKLNMTTDQVKAYIPDVLRQFSNAIKVRFYSELKNQFISKFLIYILILARMYMVKEEDHFGYTTQVHWVACHTF